MQILILKNRHFELEWDLVVTDCKDTVMCCTVEILLDVEGLFNIHGRNLLEPKGGFQTVLLQPLEEIIHQKGGGTVSGRGSSTFRISNSHICFICMISHYIFADNVQIMFSQLFMLYHTVWNNGIIYHYMSFLFYIH